MPQDPSVQRSVTQIFLSSQAQILSILCPRRYCVATIKWKWTEATWSKKCSTRSKPCWQTASYICWKGISWLTGCRWQEWILRRKIIFWFLKGAMVYYQCVGWTNSHVTSIPLLRLDWEGMAVMSTVKAHNAHHWTFNVLPRLNANFPGPVMLSQSVRATDLSLSFD